MKEFINKLIGRLEEKENEAVLKAPNTSDISNIEYQKWMMKSYGFKESIEIVKDLAEEHKGGWIPCSERMPEEDGKDVLVSFEYFRYGSYNRLYQTVGISYTYHGDWSGFVNGSSGWTQLRIIAWQPLPEPYKKGCE